MKLERRRHDEMPSILLSRSAITDIAFYKTVLVVKVAYQGTTTADHSRGK
jgi:hypothetical protein